MNKALLCLAFPLQALALDAQTICLAKNIYWEARGEPLIGQYAVASVTLNRVAHKRFPNTICRVVYQRNQFSWTITHKRARIRDVVAWQVAKYIARSAREGLIKDVTGGATHYHATYVKPRWRRHFLRTVKIHKHIFYRFHNASK
jgi:spore germination cell wall hydrolase CwlJ-like protein